MIHFPRLAACALAGSLVGMPAWAQPAASPPPQEAALPGPEAGTVALREALDAAWQRAATAREAEGQRRRAEAERLAGTRLWAASPALELSHRADRLPGRSGGRETEVGVAVPLWLPGQRAARAGAADALAAQAKAAEQAARLRLAGELREAAWAVVAAQAELSEADAQATALRQLAEDVDRRVRAGDLARADSLAAHAEHLSGSSATADVRLRLQVALSRWTLLTGLAAVPQPSRPVAPDAADPDLDRHPERQLASLSTELARQRVDLMRHSRRDAPELRVGVRQDSPGRGESSQGSVVVGLRLPFGGDDRNLPLEAVALSELDTAQTLEERLREQLASDTASAREALRSAQVQLEAATARARLLRERASLIEKSFRAGETPLPDLLQAMAGAAQANGAVARRTAALGLAHARLHQSLGILP